MSVLTSAQVAIINAQIKDSIREENPYTLWFVVTTYKQLVKVPVYSYEEAVRMVHALDDNRVTGIRIARMDESEGCEVYLHKFE